MSLVGKNPEFGVLHYYYKTRKINSLKKMQSLMAGTTKIIRVFCAMLTKGVEYDLAKMLGDIKRPTVYMQAALKVKRKQYVYERGRFPIIGVALS